MQVDWKELRVTGDSRGYALLLLWRYQVAGHILSGNLCGSSDMQLEVKVLGLLSFSVTVVWCVTQVKSPNSFVFWFILSVKWGIVVIY